MSKTLSGALAGLDPKNDEHWTNAGLARLDVLSDLLGEPITRQQLQEHGPEGFERDTAAGFTWEGADLGSDELESGALEAAKHMETALASDEPDAFALIEAFCAAVTTDRYRKNRELQDVAKTWMIHQKAARDWQARIDKRAEMNARTKRLAAQD